MEVACAHPNASPWYRVMLADHLGPGYRVTVDHSDVPEWSLAHITLDRPNSLGVSRANPKQLLCWGLAVVSPVLLELVFHGVW